MVLEAAQESLDVVFLSQTFLKLGLIATLSILIAICDMGLDEAESLTPMVKELRSEFTASSSSASAA